MVVGAYQYEIAGTGNSSLEFNFQKTVEALATHWLSDS